MDTYHTAAGIVRHGITDSRIELEDMPTHQRHLDELEGELITSYIHDGYSCGFGADKSPCSSTFSAEHYRLVRCGMAELTHDKLDLVVMGQVVAGCFTGETSAHYGQLRGKTYTAFYHNGVRICKYTA